MMIGENHLSEWGVSYIKISTPRFMVADRFVYKVKKYQFKTLDEAQRFFQDKENVIYYGCSTVKHDGKIVFYGRLDIVESEVKLGIDELEE